MFFFSRHGLRSSNAPEVGNCSMQSARESKRRSSTDRVPPREVMALRSGGNGHDNGGGGDHGESDTEVRLF